MANDTRPGRAKCAQFIMIENRWARSREFARLSDKAQALFYRLATFYNGFNNGNLSAAYVLMKPLGSKSKGTLYDALGELLETGWLRKTRQGGKNKCSLYALTVFPIDECKGIHDARPTTTAPHDWKNCNPTRPEGQSTRPAGQLRHQEHALNGTKQHDYPPSGPIEGDQLPAQRTPLYI